MNEDIEKKYYQTYGIIIFLTLVGIGTSIYLSLSHYWNYTDATYSSFCAISQAINCDTVTQSPWSIFLGIPVAHWGLFGYLIFLIVLILLRSPTDSLLSLWAVSFILATVFSLISIYLGYISASKIKSYCILCLTNYSINFLLFYFCFFLRNKVTSNSVRTDFFVSTKYLKNNKFFLTIFSILIASFIFLQIVIPRYWLLDNFLPSSQLNTGVTEQGFPWIGAEAPDVVIEQFSDYQCFQCAKTHLMLRRLIEQNPSSIRLIHRHYPMDHEFNPLVVPEPFHVGSGRMALLAIFAQSKGKFWEMNDILFEQGRLKKPFDTNYLEEKTGIPSGELSASLSHPLFKKD